MGVLKWVTGLNINLPVEQKERQMFGNFFAWRVDLLRSIRKNCLISKRLKQLHEQKERCNSLTKCELFVHCIALTPPLANWFTFINRSFSY